MIKIFKVTRFFLFIAKRLIFNKKNFQCPETVIYIPNFITSEEEQQLIGSVKNAPKPKWTQLAHRRLLNYGGIPHTKGMIAEEIPKWLQVYVAKINGLGKFFF